jgi:hypothetical protein
LYERIENRFVDVFLYEMSRSFTKKEQSVWIGFILRSRKEERKPDAPSREDLDSVHDLITEFKSLSAEPFIPDPPPTSGVHPLCETKS